MEKSRRLSGGLAPTSKYPASYIRLVDDKLYIEFGRRSVGVPTRIDWTRVLVDKDILQALLFRYLAPELPMLPLPDCKIVVIDEFHTIVICPPSKLLTKFRGNIREAVIHKLKFVLSRTNYFDIFDGEHFLVGFDKPACKIMLEFLNEIS